MNEIEDDKSSKWNQISFIEKDTRMAYMAKRYIRSTYHKEAGTNAMTKAKFIAEIREDRIQLKIRK